MLGPLLAGEGGGKSREEAGRTSGVGWKRKVTQDQKVCIVVYRRDPSSFVVTRDCSLSFIAVRCRSGAVRELLGLSQKGERRSSRRSSGHTNN